ncbi:TPA: glycosyltransferase family 2 protein [Pseudomonas putida]|uniref:glycosyltransferase family 2 protein n=1 Tax=Pseudomonas putida TaxID=303 RepID=UPI002363F4BF|nr:glycosyltransferase family 2 protein [Pseudomonas putida]MDD2151121.1 glycosyltransferase family 2 protein [Pseudomonas putida]HDS1681672.1 glycosyltransferase family 2 protein [Pseudomonas putida]
MLTVVIPSYNHVDYIAESLQAALSIDVPGLKVLVVDDGSKDGSVARVETLIEQLGVQDKVKLVAKANGGLVSSLNLALTLIETEFCWIVASDDILVPQGVKELCQRIHANPALGFILGGGRYFSEDGVAGPIYKESHRRFFDLEINRRAREIFTDFPSPILLQSSIFRVRALKEVGGWDVALKWDDYPMFVKLLNRYPHKGREFDFLPEVDCVRYRQHSNNTYRNIAGQYFMVREAMHVLAPADVRGKAISRALAFYILLSLKNRNMESLSRMLRGSAFFDVVSGFVNVPSVALKYILGKI